MQDQLMTEKYQVQDIVERLLPHENFFAYKICKYFSPEQKAFEAQQINQIIKKLGNLSIELNLISNGTRTLGTSK